MNRKDLAVPDEEVAEEFGRVVGLLQRAKDKPHFRSLMSEAKRQGLNWVEALEYVVEGATDVPSR